MQTDSPVSASYPPFRRPTFRRAHSPTTWACYEQIHTEEDASDSASCDSCSEDGDDYHGAPGPHSDDGESEDESEDAVTPVISHKDIPASSDADTMDIDAVEEHSGSASAQPVDEVPREDVKGKQRAVDPPEESPRKHRRQHRRRREPVVVYRPILTIQKSQGFVWNQDLFVPPYIKDRYITSTSPPGAGFVSSSDTSVNEYEVEVVEIRVQEGDLAELIP